MAKEKIWIIKSLENFFIEKGINPEVSDYLTVTITILAIAVMVYIIDIILNKFVIVLLHKLVANKRTKWDDYLLAHNFFKRSSRLVVVIVLIQTIGYLLQGHSSDLIHTIVVIMQILAVVFIVMMIFSVIDSLHDFYKTLPRSREKSIKNYMQTLKVMIYFVATIVVLIILFNLKLASFLTGLAAFAAVLSLVFKDMLLGFIASIQLSVQDMVRLGDWLELPSGKANGIVVDLNLTTVKVQNWDNTFSFIPIYTLTNQSFINWRGMEKGGGRRFAKTFYIDVTSIIPLSNEQVGALSSSVFFAAYYSEMTGNNQLTEQGEEVGEQNKQQTQEQNQQQNEQQVEQHKTNLSLFRNYLIAYLTKHTKLNNSLTTMVRYRDIEHNGLPLQLYGFTKTKEWVEYENTVSDIIENMLRAASELNILIYQRTGSTPTVVDIEKKDDNESMNEDIKENINDIVEDSK